jgi:hypothetical protein
MRNENQIPYITCANYFFLAHHHRDHLCFVSSATTNHNHIHRSTAANHPNNDDKVAMPCPIHPPPSSTAMNSGVQNLVISLGAMQLTPLPLRFTSYSSANPHDSVVAASPTDKRQPGILLTCHIVQTLMTCVVVFHINQSE